MDSNKVTTVRSVFSELLEHNKISKSKLEADYYALKDLLIRNFCILNSH